MFAMRVAPPRPSFLSLTCLSPLDFTCHSYTDPQAFPASFASMDTSFAADRMTSVSVCSGMAGLDVALLDTVRPVLWCEVSVPARTLLRARMRSQHLPFAPIHDDLRTLTPARMRRLGITEVDFVVGGTSCQDLSTLGQGNGIGEGTRSGLLHDFVRLVEELVPSFVVWEARIPPSPRPCRVRVRVVYPDLMHPSPYHIGPHALSPLQPPRHSSTYRTSLGSSVKGR